MPPQLIRPPESSALGARLWALANVLRSGGVRPADYQAFIIPLLCLKLVSERVELRSASSQGLPAGCSFAELAVARTGAGRVLRQALARIERVCPDLAGVFLDTDYGQLSDDTMGKLYRLLADVDLTAEHLSRDALGQAYEYLLGKFADATGAKAGQYFTPHGVAQLLVALCDPRPGESVYDPACGSGGLLNVAAEHAAAVGSRRSVSLYGQELDPQSFAIARVNMLVHDNDAALARGDTLTSPAFTSDGTLQRFDVVVANPPFGMENTAAQIWDEDPWGRNRWGRVVRKPSELAFVAHIASSLRDPGAATSTITTPELARELAREPARAAIVLPLGALFRGGIEAATRTSLLDAGVIDAVIALPENLFYNTPIPAAVLVLRSPARQAGEVLIIDATACSIQGTKRRALSVTDIATITDAYRQRGSLGRVRAETVPVTVVKAADGDLSVGRWLPAAPPDTISVTDALAALRTAEASATQAQASLWAHLHEAGYA